MRCRIRLSAYIFTARPGHLYTLPLSFSPVLEIIARDLQSQPQQHFLHRLEHDLGNAGGVGSHVGQIHDTRHGKTGALRTDRINQLFGLLERKPADAVDLLRK